MLWKTNPEEALEVFLQAHTMPNGKAYTPATIKVYLAMWRSFLGYLDDHGVAPESAGEEMLGRFLDSGLGTSRTRRRYLSLVGLAFSEMCKAGLRSSNPAESLLRQFREGPRPLPVALTETEEAKVREQLLVSESWKKVRDRALLLVILDAGLRVGELVGLTLDRLHLSESPAFIEVDGLSDARLAPVASKSLAAIQEWIALRETMKIPKDLVFPSSRSGGQLVPSTVYRMAAAVMAKAGLQKSHQGPHVLRNTFAVRQLRNGKPLSFVRTCIGHQRITSTEPYRRLVVPGEPA